MSWAVGIEVGRPTCSAEALLVPSVGCKNLTKDQDKERAPGDFSSSSCARSALPFRLCQFTGGSFDKGCRKRFKPQF